MLPGLERGWTHLLQFVRSLGRSSHPVSFARCVQGLQVASQGPCSARLSVEAAMLVFFVHWAGLHLLPRLHAGAVVGGWDVRPSEIESCGKAMTTREGRSGI